MKGYEEMNKPEKLHKLGRSAFALSLSSSSPPGFGAQTDDLLRLNISLNANSYDTIHKLRSDVSSSPLFKAICVAQQLQLYCFRFTI